MFTLRRVGKYRNPYTIKKIDNLYIFERSGVKRLYNIAQSAEESSNTASAAIVIGFSTLIVFFIIVFLYSHYKTTIYNNHVIYSTNAL
jgi:hypothetical protein